MSESHRKRGRDRDRQTGRQWLKEGGKGWRREKWSQRYK